MTTKEFQRRTKEFSKLNSAAHYFENQQLDSIFKLTLIKLDGQSEVHFISDTIISKLLPDDYSGVWFDRFSREEFEIQFKYFLAFVNRLSKHQFSVMLAQSKELGLTHLLEYSAINNDCKQ